MGLDRAKMHLSRISRQLSQAIETTSFGGISGVIASKRLPSRTSDACASGRPEAQIFDNDSFFARWKSASPIASRDEDLEHRFWGRIPEELLALGALGLRDLILNNAGGGISAGIAPGGRPAEKGPGARER